MRGERKEVTEEERRGGRRRWLLCAGLRQRRCRLGMGGALEAMPLPVTGEQRRESELSMLKKVLTMLEEKAQNRGSVMVRGGGRSSGDGVEGFVRGGGRTG
ncbi:hypothetical protein U1Q18_048976 [Sarracenia purpurea var. burkii]